MSSAAVGSHSGAGPLSLMSCVRESSPLPENDREYEKNGASKKKFWNLKKWFKRKRMSSEEDGNQLGPKESPYSRSIGELSDAEDDTRRRSSSSMHPGLSVSHDSVFQSPHSGSSDLELDVAQSSSSLSMSQHHADSLQTELSERLRLRRFRGDTSEDDEGLPRSPCNSPTTTDGHLHKTAIKDLPTKSHSTCSDGSLLSMGSSEMDEDSFGLNSRHSSKLSLHDKRNADQDSDIELGLSTSATPLNHSAAHHRVAVRPKRTHGAPRRKRGQQLSSALPATPEVNEDSSTRSITPDCATRVTVTDLYSLSSSKRSTLLTESQLKCSSLPPGLVGPGADSKLNRSKSNAGSKSQDHFAALTEHKEEKSFFQKLIRSSGKRKKKEKHQEHLSFTSQTQTHSQTTHIKREETKPVAAPRSTAASRQRMQPMNIPGTPEEAKKDLILPKPSPEKSQMSLSPIHSELENRFKQRQSIFSTSPTKSISSPPNSPKLSKSPVLTRTEHIHFTKSTTTTKHFESRSEEIRSKAKIAGLSSLQQRVISLNEDETDNSFKSLTELPSEKEKTKPLIKSHSFKASVEEKEKRVSKAASTDSVASAFDTPVASEFKIEFKSKNSRESVSSDILKDVKEITNELISDIKDNFPESSKNNKEIRNEMIADTQDDKFKHEDKEVYNESSGITISGPCHTAVVNITSNNVESYSSSSKTKNEVVEKDVTKSISVKESQISVTKINLKHETTVQTRSTIKSDIPEFFNMHLNKVELKQPTNVVLSIKSPRVIEERPKTLNIDVEKEHGHVTPRKFSKDNVEIIEKETEIKKEEVKPVTNIPPSPFRFKKNDKIPRKSPVELAKAFPNNRSSSLDSLRNESSESNDKSSQDSLDNLDSSNEKSSPIQESVVLRRKSVVNRKKDDEPELMKVFARRSLKLKDGDSDSITQSIENMNDNKTRDSDKENYTESPTEERKKSSSKEVKDIKDTLHSDIKEKIEQPETKEPLAEIEPVNIAKDAPMQKEQTVESNVEVTLRNKNNKLPYQRTLSLNPPRNLENVPKKLASFNENKRKTDFWPKNNQIEKASEELITSPNCEKVNEENHPEPKNFNQRKAEWEKRAQLAKKNTIP